MNGHDKYIHLNLLKENEKIFIFVFPTACLDYFLINAYLLKHAKHLCGTLYIIDEKRKTNDGVITNTLLCF